MYCSNCGNQLVQALSFCNHCGAGLRPLKIPGEVETPAKSIANLVWVIVGTTITILGMALGALVLMKDGTIDQGLGTVFVILSFVAFMVVEGVLIWRLVDLNRHTTETGALTPAKNSGAEELAGLPARALEDPGEPVPSVTEHTTRAFEPYRREGE